MKNNTVIGWVLVALDAQVMPLPLCLLSLSILVTTQSNATYSALSWQSVRSRWRHSVKMREHYTTKRKQKKEASFCTAN